MFIVDNRLEKPDHVIIALANKKFIEARGEKLCADLINVPGAARHLAVNLRFPNLRGLFTAAEPCPVAFFADDLGADAVVQPRNGDELRSLQRDHRFEKHTADALLRQTLQEVQTAPSFRCVVNVVMALKRSLNSKANLRLVLSLTNYLLIKFADAMTAMKFPDITKAFKFRFVKGELSVLPVQAMVPLLQKYIREGAENMGVLLLQEAAKASVEWEQKTLKRMENKVVAHASLVRMSPGVQDQGSHR